jgi:flagellar hook-associated protein 1 FlgK
MSLDGALSVAISGLANINSRLGLVSNNVANANTPDYSAELGNQQSLVAGSMPLGVHTEAATRAVDLALQQSSFRQDTIVATLTTTTNSLGTIDALQGTPGQGNDLGSLLGKVQSAFSSLLGDPSNQPLQSAVVNAAGTLTTSINTLSTAYTQQRQVAQTDIVAQVTSINTSLAQIGSLSDRIIGARVGGQSTADLENLRDAAVHSLGGIIGIKTLNQPNGDLIITTATGTQLQTRAANGPLQTSNVVIGASASVANGGIPAITLGGTDVTRQLQGGRLGADITLRDATLPTFQGELDEFSQSLATRFDAQGLTLFTDSSGNVPTGGGVPAQTTYIGFSSEIQVNPAIRAAPSLVRDGTHDVAGSPTSASAFSANVAGGPAGFTAMISRVLNFTFGAQAQPNVAQPPGATGALGPDGSLTAPYSAPATLADNATALVSAQAAVSADATGQLSIEQTIQTTLTSRLNKQSGVNMDTEMAQMIQLQNAYGANARIISTVQAMFTQLLAALR